MSHLIEFALNHMNSSSAPLVLHSLSPASTSSLPKSAQPQPNSASTAAAQPTALSQPNKTSDSALTKLVSICEMIKRAHAPPASTCAPNAAKDKGKAKAVAGLHQYTKIGALEEMEGSTAMGEGEGGAGGVSGGAEALDDAARMDAVAMSWLKTGGGGTKRPRRKHTPFMLVVLAKEPLEKVGRWQGFTCQPPDGLSPPTKQLKSNKRAAADAKADKATEAAEGAEKEAELAEGGMAVEAPHKKRRKRRPKKKKSATAGEGEGGEDEVEGEEPRPVESMEL